VEREEGRLIADPRLLISGSQVRVLDGAPTFDRHFGALSALDALEHYPWPDNVRELATTIERVRIIAGVRSSKRRIFRNTSSPRGLPSFCLSQLWSEARRLGIDRATLATI